MGCSICYCNFRKNNFSEKKITILGGKSSVNDKVFSELQRICPSVERLAGGSRYDTSRLIAEKYFPNASKAVLAYGEKFPDGLSGGPLALEIGAPLLLVNQNKMNANLIGKYTHEKNITTGYVLGGPTLVTDESATSIFNN